MKQVKLQFMCYAAAFVFFPVLYYNPFIMQCRNHAEKRIP